MARGVWWVSAFVVFAMAAVYFSRGLTARNWAFTSWLTFGVALELYGAFYIGRYDKPAWMLHVVSYSTEVDIALALLSVGVALTSLNQLNGVIATGVGIILVLDAMLYIVIPRSLSGEIQSLVYSVAYLIPSVWMTGKFSGLRMDMLPLSAERFERLVSTASALAFSILR